MALALLAAGCGGAPPATFTEVYALFFPVQKRAQCNFCHSLPPNAKSNGKLSMGMDQATAYAALLGTVSTTKGCEGRSYIVPGRPQTSLFHEKLTGTPPCGSGMPLGGDALTVEELGIVESWITAGAHDD